MAGTHEPVLFSLLLSDIMSQEELFKRALQNLDKKIHAINDDHTSLIASSREVLNRFMKETGTANRTINGIPQQQQESGDMNNDSAPKAEVKRDVPAVQHHRSEKLDERITLQYDWTHVTQEDDRVQMDAALVRAVRVDAQCDRNKAATVSDDVANKNVQKSRIARVVKEWKAVSLALQTLEQTLSATASENAAQREKVEAELGKTDEERKALEVFRATQPKAQMQNALKLNHVQHGRLDTIFTATGRLDLQQMENACGNINKSCEDLTSEKNEVVQYLTGDIDSVQHLHDRIVSEKRTSYVAFDSAVGKLQKELQRNEEAQSQTWTELFACVDKLTKLGEDRRLLIQGIVRQKQEYDDEVEALTNCESSIAEYEAVAGAVKDALVGEVELIGKLQDSAQVSVREAGNRVTRFEEDNDYAKRILEERLQYSKAFQKYFNVASHIIIDQQATVRELQGQLESSKQMLRKQQHTNAPSEQLAVLDTHITHITQVMDGEVSRLDALQDESSKEIELYKPTEEALGREASGLLDDSSSISKLLRKMETDNLNVLEEEVKGKKEAVTKTENEIKEGRADPSAVPQLSPLRRRRLKEQQQSNVSNGRPSAGT